MVSNGIYKFLFFASHWQTFCLQIRLQVRHLQGLQYYNTVFSLSLLHCIIIKLGTVIVVNKFKLVILQL